MDTRDKRGHGGQRDGSSGTTKARKLSCSILPASCISI